MSAIADDIINKVIYIYLINMRKTSDFYSFFHAGFNTGSHCSVATHRDGTFAPAKVLVISVVVLVLSVIPCLNQGIIDLAKTETRQHFVSRNYIYEQDRKLLHRNLS